MEITMLKLGEIKPYGKNPRKNDQAVKAVKKSIEEFGFKVPIVVDKDKVIITGHTRYKASKELGLEEVPCIIATDLSEDKVKAFRLADNRTNEFAEWDLDLLKEELGEIEMDLSEFDFDFALDEEEPTEIVEDEIPEVDEVEAICKYGEKWQLGNHTLMCGDSTSSEMVKKLMGGAVADLVFTDPPYNVNYADKNNFLNEIDKGNRIQEDIENDNFKSDDDCMEKLWLPVFKNLYDVANGKCAIYVTMPQGSAHIKMSQCVQEAGWKVKQELQWVKNNHVLGRCDYLYKHEPILYGWKDTHNWYGKGNFTKSVWEIAKPQKSDLHPTMKPIELIANALLNSTKQDDLVLDLFGGSGSTLIACEQLNRKCYMMELDPRYCDVIIKRWETLTGKKAVKIEE